MHVDYLVDQSEQAWYCIDGCLKEIVKLLQCIFNYIKVIFNKSER